MGSLIRKLLKYEKELTREKILKKGPTITVSGPSCSGKTAVARHLASKLGLKYLSAGEIFREVAKERNIDLETLSETREDEIDLKTDLRTLRYAMEGGVVLDGRLTGWAAGDYADVRVYVTAPVKVRARWLASREGIEYEEALKRIKRRDEADARKYLELYGVDMGDMSIYHLVVNTGELELEEKLKLVYEFVKCLLKRKTVA